METINIETLKQSDFQVRESYKNLRTNIMLSGKENRVIMITSCGPNEGKSTVSFNLAVSMAETGKRVLFLDVDLRKSVLVGRYKIRKAIKGVTHYLSGQNSLEEVMYRTNLPNLSVIFSGPVPPNPSELLGSDDFYELVQKLKSDYDYVIVDTPPLGSVIDAAIVAQSCDAAVMVIAANSVSYKFAQNVIEQLKMTNIRIIGTVLNKVDLSEN
ncbi:MAG: CpsD/CapB family tyrosine-protein kinase, partial [Eubacteriales bacterium]|nr:CpsD/CapB family tyrosine-protein kinase [Eubacteriales bacterium]